MNRGNQQLIVCAADCFALRLCRYKIFLGDLTDKSVRGH